MQFKLLKVLPILFMMSSEVYAGSQTGKIHNLYARASDGLHLVSLTGGGAKTGSPSCAIKDYWLIKDEKSITGKSQFSQLLAAKVSGKTVTIVGLNTCSRWRDGEDINTIIIK